MNYTDEDANAFVNKVVDANYEVFWRQVAEAYDYVLVNHKRRISFSRAGRAVSIAWAGKPEGSRLPDRVRVIIMEIPNEQPKLIVPSGQD